LTSTYLVAFVVSDFEVNEELNDDKILFRVFSRPDQIDNTDFGITTAIEALKIYENAFETKYELKKLDQVALPVFNRGGMENYGIVFYREDYLLYEPGVTTAFDKEFAAATIVHEVRRFENSSNNFNDWFSSLGLPQVSR
jgi:aminopeptidase N